MVFAGKVTEVRENRPAAEKEGFLEQFENWSGVFPRMAGRSKAAPFPLVAAWLALCLQTNTEYALNIIVLQINVQVNSNDRGCNLGFDA